MAYTLIFQCYRKEDVDEDEFRSHWTGEHAEVAATIPGVRHYEILYTTEALEADDAPDGFVLMRFDSKEDAEAGLGSEAMAEAGKDAANYFRHFSTFHVDSHQVV